MDSSEWIVLPPIFWAETPVAIVESVRYWSWGSSSIAVCGSTGGSSFKDWRYLYNQEIRREIFHDHLGK
ncbi:unnamed protein product [Rhizophagus irregularis]|nr:unnamed protein product [Rhizophagus irregularis]CAB4417019.1 unnamed protein product [Rhizophagus irregularis]